MSIEIIGQSVYSDEINAYLDKIIADWKNKTKDAQWSIFKNSYYFFEGVKLLVTSIDGLILKAEELLISGPDKKATVLSNVGMLYDAVLVEMMPFWLKPFKGYIKQVIVDNFISAIIDLIVAKYKDGIWSIKEE